MYIHFFWIAFKRQASFKLANLSGLFTNTFFMLFRAAILGALFDSRSFSHIENLSSKNQVLTYVVWAQALIMVIPQWGHIGVGEDIRSGQIAVDLSRPFNYYIMMMSKRLGVSCFFFLARAIPALILGAICGLFQTVPDFFHYMIGMISLVFGIWLSNSLHFLVELSGFWLESPRGPKMLFISMTYFLSGATLPVALFPSWAQEISFMLPFSSTLNSTIEIFLCHSNALSVLLTQFLWLIVISFLCLFFLKRGEKKVVLHGG